MKGHSLRKVLRINCHNTVPREDLGWKVNPPRASIFHRIPCNVCELERKAEVTGTVKGPCITNAHNHGHHHSHYAGYVVAVVQSIRQGFVVTLRHIHLEAGQQFLDVPQRDLVAINNPAKRFKNRFIYPRAFKGSRSASPQEIETVHLFGAVIFLLVMAQGLAVNDVVAVATPGVEHDCVFTGPLVKQPSSRREALGAVGDCEFAAGYDRITHG
jgi:hypothetical protein